MVSRWITWAEVYQRLAGAPPGKLYGASRGGAIVAGLTGRAVDQVDSADYLVDDIVSGTTSISPLVGKPVWSLFDRERDGIGDQQLLFPWGDGTRMRSGEPRLEQIGRELLEALGYDPTKEGLRETPGRWARWWEEFIHYDPGEVDTSFEETVASQLVVVSGIRLWSVCEHHLLPFDLNVAIGYVPHGRLLGLSKFARLGQAAAHRLQLQERLVGQLLEGIKALTQSPDVAVAARGRHLCLEARGVKSRATASSLVVSGRFEEFGLQQSFLALAMARLASTDRQGS